MTSYIIASKKLGTIDGRRILTCIVKASAAASAMGLVVYQLTEFIGSRIDLAAAAGRIFQVIVPMGAGAVIYFALTLVLRMEELKFVGEMFRRRR